MLGKDKTVKVPVVEEGAIRKESITDGESLMLAFRTLVVWAQESKKKGWGHQDRFPISVFIVNLDPADYHRMKLETEKSNHKVKMSMLGFVNALTPGEVSEIMKDVVRAYNRNSLNQLKARK